MGVCTASAVLAWGSPQKKKPSYCVESVIVGYLTRKYEVTRATSSGHLTRGDKMIFRCSGQRNDQWWGTLVCARRVKVGFAAVLGSLVITGTLETSWSIVSVSLRCCKFYHACLELGMESSQKRAVHQSSCAHMRWHTREG